MNLLVDGLGVLGIATTVMVYQQKERKPLLFWKLATDCVWLLHYLFLGAYSACAITVVAIFRSAVFLNAEKKWAQGRSWLYIFLAATLLLSLLAWQGPCSLLTLVSSILCIIAYWLKTPRMTRILSLPAAFLVLIYNIAFHSREGVLCELFIITSAVIGIIRHAFQKKAPSGAE